MKRSNGYILLVKKIALFLFPLFIMFFVIEFKMRSIPNTYGEKRKWFERDLSDIEILILGNSHTVQGIDPEFIGRKAFNLASVSQSFFYDKEITLRYLDRLKSLKTVIIPVDYFSLQYSISDIADWLDYGYSQNWNIKSRNLSVWDSRNYSYTMLYTPASSLHYLFEGKGFSLANGMKENGFTPIIIDTSKINLFINDKSGLERVRFHNKMINSKRFNECYSDLEELINSLTNKAIKVVLIESPVWTTYSKFCDLNILRKNREVVKEFSIKYDCLYRSYFEDPRFEINDFTDNDHLSMRGARKFANILKSDLLSF